MNNGNFISKDLNGLLEKYLSKDQIESYIRTIATNFIPKHPLRLTDTGNQLNKYFNENVKTKSIRIFADTLITFVSKALAEHRYIDFLLDFSKLILIQGEKNLSYEISNLIIQLSSKNKAYENYHASALLHLAEYHMSQANTKEALHYIKSARTIFESLKDNFNIGKCEFLVGAIYVEQGDLKAGKVRLENCLNYINPDNDKLLSAQIDVHFGIICYVEGKLDEAQKHYNQASKIFEQLGDQRRLCEVLINQAMIYRKQNNIQRALEVYNYCSEIARENGFAPILNLCFINKTEIYWENKEIDRASKYSQKALELSYLLNDRYSIAEVHKLNGLIAKRQSNYTLAENYLLTSLRLNEELDQKLNAAETNHELGNLYTETGNNNFAMQYLMAALKYYTKITSKSKANQIEVQLQNLAVSG